MARLGWFRSRVQYRCHQRRNRLSNAPTRRHCFAPRLLKRQTSSINKSNNERPNGRVNISYDVNKEQNVSFTLFYNSNRAGSNSINEYTSINQFIQVYKLSDRFIQSNTLSSNPNLNVTYTIKGKNPKEILRCMAGFNSNTATIGRDYFQQFLNPDSSKSGLDSTQQQHTNIHNNSFSYRVSYDLPLKGEKFIISLGSNLISSVTHNQLATLFLRKPDQVFVPAPAFSNDFNYYQNVYGLRTSIRYDIIKDFYVSMGLQVDHSATQFAFKNGTDTYPNNYWSLLPFGTLTKKWQNEVNLTLSYKRSIQRPGINELNPSVDYSDPYNRRYGNPFLLPYFSNNFDLIIGKWTKRFNINASIGYDILKGIYSSIRTLQPDGKTDITWQNISGRQEYQASSWCGYTFSKKGRINFSVGTTYNVYSEHDRAVNKFRNGGSLYSTTTGSYQYSETLNANASVTFNRFASPQGVNRTALSMNIGLQQKLFKKRIVVSVSAVDPFRQQQNKNVIFGTNFMVENVSTTQTRNFRMGISYIFSKSNKNKMLLRGLEKIKSIK